MTKINVGIIGASGFTGAELLRIAAQHPHFDVRLATGDSMAGRRAADLYPSLELGYPNLVFESFDPAAIDGLDLVILGLPHAASMDLAPQIVGKVGCVVDLSAAYRLQDTTQYPEFYGFEHTQPEMLGDAVYGLPEFHESTLQGAQLIATPGCHVTAAALALKPLVDAGLIATAGIAVNSLTGITGAGRCSERREHVHQHRFEHAGVRPAHSSPHPRDRAGDRGAGVVHATPRPHEPRDPGHVHCAGHRRSVGGHGDAT